MKIFQYASSLRDTISRSDLESDLGACLSILNSQRPAATNVMRLPGNVKKDHVLSRMDHECRRSLKANVLSSYASGAQNIALNLEHLKSVVRKTLPDQISTRTATAKQLALVALTEAVLNLSSFISAFTVEYAKAKVRDNSPKGQSSMEPTLRSLESDLHGYIFAHKHLAIKPSEFKTRIAKMEDVYVTEINDSSWAALSATNDNPITQASSGFINNPIYHLGLYWGNFRANTYSLIDEERVQLELILESAQNQSDGQYSPAMERKILLLKERIAAKHSKLREIKGGY